MTADHAFRVLLVSPALVDEPLGTMYLSSSLRSAGFEVRGVLVNHGGIDATSLAALVTDWDPQVVAFSVITGEHHQCVELGRSLAEGHDHTTVFGGPYLTFAPSTIGEHPWLDAVARGECELALVELCRRLRDGLPYLDVPNFWFRDGDQIIENPLGNLPPLDALPDPDRDLFASSKDGGTYNLMTSRGCPYKCTYCFNDRYVAIHRSQSRGGERLGEDAGPVVRTRSIDAVVAEMATLAATRPVEQFNFHDDIFPLRRSRTLEFCEAYEASGLGIGWSCSVKAELLDEEIVAAMARAHCNKVYMGVEAGDDGIRHDLLLRRVGREAMQDAADLLHRHGIQLFTQSMVGLPATSIEDDIETMRFNTQLRPAFAWVSIFTPYPGTALADRAAQLGLVDESFLAQVPTTYHHRSMLRVPHADQIGLLHKLFSLGVELPDLIGPIQAVVATFAPEDLDPLHDAVFLPFRAWKHQVLADPNQPMPEGLEAFVAALRAGRIAEARLLVHDLARAAASADRRWIHRDGVSTALPGTSADRHGASP